MSARAGDPGGRPATRARRGSSPSITTVGDLLHWSYANLAMADSVESRGISRPDTLAWMIRAKLFKGLQTGTMSVGTLFTDVRDMPTGQCVYCAGVPPPSLHADHLIPRYRGGPESGDNMVWACRSCNSSKGSKDLLEWYAARAGFPSIHLMRRYLKLAIAEAQAKDLMHVSLGKRPDVAFSIEHIPTRYPSPTEPVAIAKWRDGRYAS